MRRTVCALCSAGRNPHQEFLRSSPSCSSITFSLPCRSNAHNAVGRHGQGMFWRKIICMRPTAIGSQLLRSLDLRVRAVAVVENPFGVSKLTSAAYQITLSLGQAKYLLEILRCIKWSITGPCFRAPEHLRWYTPAWLVWSNSSTKKGRAPFHRTKVEPRERAMATPTITFIQVIPKQRPFSVSG